MNILVTTPYIPGSRGGGSALRMTGIVEQLAVEHRVSLLCLLTGEETLRPGNLSSAVQLLPHVTRPAREEGGSRSAWGMVRKGLPPGAVLFSGDECRRAWRRALDDGPDLVIFQSIFPAVLARLAPAPCPVIVDAHNVEHLLLRMAGRPSTARPTRLLRWMIHWRLVRRFERRVMTDADRVLTTSDADLRRLRDLAPGTPMTVIPNGVTMDDSSTTAAPEAGRILFCGLMDYPPNIDAACWLADRIFPLISERHPEARLVLAGARPVDAVGRLGRRPGITVTGEVESMVQEIDRSTVVAVPLRQGSGTRLKILEAWSRARPVVTTPIGGEGLNIEPGVNALVNADPRGFADEVCRLLDDPSACREMGLAGRRTVADQYAWPQVGQQLRQLLLR